jgi:hypothetical protein
VHDTVAGVAQRLRETLPPEKLVTLTPTEVLSHLTPEERDTLGSEHIRFRVDVPVRVVVLRDASLGGEPFWLAARDFKPAGQTYQFGDHKFEAWQKDFAAGSVGLGINSFRGGGNHYLVLVQSVAPESGVVIDQLYPGQLRLEEAASGVKPYVDRDETLEEVPDEFRGWTVVRTQRRQRDDARLIGLYRVTEHVASPRPDQIVLTWNGDPKTTQAIQWRTDPSVSQAFLAYQKQSRVNRPIPDRFIHVQAKTEPMVDLNLVNDPIVNRHTAILEALEPGTTYLYSVGDGSADGWSELSSFTTAPAGTTAFSFIYMGDAQNGLDRWGTLLANAFRERPDAAFYLMAGDLVNRGNDRDDWDDFFDNAASVYDRRQLVPVIGNHECQGGDPTTYLQLFALPDNGPPNVERGRAYSFNYSNALFVILDSNLDPEDQAAWLAEQLASSAATWKFVAYHHPAYSSAPNRDNHDIRDWWTPLFDKYHVDLALQGHDHAYLRTYPMRGTQRVDDPSKGTIYIVSVSGTKMYEQADRDYTEFGMTNVSTYQVLDIQISGNRLGYRAYDLDGDLRDEFVIEK